MQNQNQVTLRQEHLGRPAAGRAGARRERQVQCQCEAGAILIECLILIPILIPSQTSVNAILGPARRWRR